MIYKLWVLSSYVVVYESVIVFSSRTKDMYVHMIPDREVSVKNQKYILKWCQVAMIKLPNYDELSN